MRKAFFVTALAAAGLAASGATAGDKLAAADLVWQQMIPGVDFAPAYGDWEKEAHGKYVRFAPGTKVPMHTHGAPYSGVMISGRMVNLLDGGKQVEIAAGDYWEFQGGQPHGHECKSSDGCFFYTHSGAAWDLELVEGD